MTNPTPRVAWLTVALLACSSLTAQTQKFKHTDSRRGYAHYIDLYDADGNKVDPSAENPRPYSARETCKKCHDVEQIEHGWHFNTSRSDGRRGEPWVLTEPRTATQLPLSYRGWPGTWKPGDLGMSAGDFVKEFGRHMPGGAKTYTGDESDNWASGVAGFDVDCMACHAADRSWSHDRWARQIDQENYAWAATAAIGLGTISGSAKGLPDDFDPKAEGAAAKLPKVTYQKARFDGEKKVFFDVVRTPPDSSCYSCHTTHEVGDNATPRWVHDGDVHLRAGMSCADCHRNGLAHHTVRGFKGEEHPSGRVETLSCRGCHMGTDEEAGGRLGAPKPLHKGLPPLHLDKLSCTACHSGPTQNNVQVQTSLAHGLGLASQTRNSEVLPTILQPILRRDANGVITPHRATWPSFWGWQTGEVIAPMLPSDALRTVRKAFRVRRDLQAENADATPEEFRTKLQKGLTEFAKKPPSEGAVPVFVAGGKVWALDGESVVSREHDVAKPYEWPIAHDVRPARLSIGATGCAECHGEGSAFFHSETTAQSPIPDEAPSTEVAMAAMDLDPEVMAAWNIAFEQRDAFKIVGLVAVGIALLVLLLHVLVGFDAIIRAITGRGASKREVTE